MIEKSNDLRLSSTDKDKQDSLGISEVIDFDADEIQKMKDMLAPITAKWEKYFTNGLVDKIRKYMPDCSISTDIIVGFPGETEAHFDHLVSFVQKQHFDHLGVFTWETEMGEWKITLFEAFVPMMEYNGSEKIEVSWTIIKN